MALSLYFDEDSGERELLAALRARGFDCIAASDAGMLTQPDSDELEFAAKERRVLVTSNQGDFARLHREWMRTGKGHGGIMVVPQQRYDIGERLERLLRFLERESGNGLSRRIFFLGNFGG